MKLNDKIKLHPLLVSLLSKYIFHSKITGLDIFNDHYMSIDQLTSVIYNRKDVKSDLDNHPEVKSKMEGLMKKYVVLVNWKYQTDYSIATNIIFYLNNLDEVFPSNPSILGDIQIAIFAWLILPNLYCKNDITEVYYFDTMQYNCSKYNVFSVNGHGNRIHIYLTNIETSVDMYPINKGHKFPPHKVIGTYNGLITSIYKYTLMMRSYVSMTLVDGSSNNHKINHIYVFNPFRFFYPIFFSQTQSITVTFLNQYDTICIDWNDYNKSVFKYRDLFMNKYPFDAGSINIPEEVSCILKRDPKVDICFKFPIFEVFTKSSKLIYVIPELLGDKDINEFKEVKDYVRFF